MFVPTRDEIDRAVRWFEQNPADIDHLIKGRVSQGAAWHAATLARAAIAGPGPAGRDLTVFDFMDAVQLGSGEAAAEHLNCIARPAAGPGVRVDLEMGYQPPGPGYPPRCQFCGTVDYGSARWCCDAAMEANDR